MQSIFKKNAFCVCMRLLIFGAAVIRALNVLGVEVYRSPGVFRLEWGEIKDAVSYNVYETFWPDYDPTFVVNVKGRTYYFCAPDRYNSDQYTSLGMINDYNSSSHSFGVVGVRANGTEIGTVSMSPRYSVGNPKYAGDRSWYINGPKELRDKSEYIVGYQYGSNVGYGEARRMKWTILSGSEYVDVSGNWMFESNLAQHIYYTYDLVPYTTDHIIPSGLFLKPKAGLNGRQTVKLKGEEV